MNRSISSSSSSRSISSASSDRAIATGEGYRTIAAITAVVAGFPYTFTFTFSTGQAEELMRTIATSPTYRSIS